jgi:hypothetical protein
MRTLRPPRRRTPLAAGAHLAALACLVGASGCEDKSDFSTGPGESYCGAIVLGGSFRTGLSTKVQMRLKIDAEAIDDAAGSPGVVSTFEAADEVSPARRLLDNAPLRPIPPLLHDPLSHAEFGDDRERNAIFAVSPADVDAESMLAIVSLRTDDRVEVRLLRPGVADAGDGSVVDGRRTLFGIFMLERQAGDCGF